jgi:hypothetical protein
VISVGKIHCHRVLALKWRHHHLDAEHCPSNNALDANIKEIATCLIERPGVFLMRTQVQARSLKTYQSNLPRKVDYPSISRPVPSRVVARSETRPSAGGRNAFVVLQDVDFTAFMRMHDDTVLPSRSGKCQRDIRRKRNVDRERNFPGGADLTFETCKTHGDLLEAKEARL